MTNSLNRVGSFQGALAANPYASSSSSDRLTPDDELIFVVRGIFSTCVIEESAADLRKIDELIAKGAHVNYKSTIFGGYTPLIYAAYHGYSIIAQHLLLKGADPSITEDKGYTASSMAQYYLTRYTNGLAREQLKSLPDMDMIDFYTRRIARYQAVVDIFKPKSI